MFFCKLSMVLDCWLNNKITSSLMGSNKMGSNILCSFPDIQMSLLIQWQTTKKLGNIITQSMVGRGAAVQPCTSLFDPNKTRG